MNNIYYENDTNGTNATNGNEKENGKEAFQKLAKRYFIKKEDNRIEIINRSNSNKRHNKNKKSVWTHGNSVVKNLNGYLLAKIIRN